MTSLHSNLTECHTNILRGPRYDLFATILKGYVTTLFVLIGTAGNVLTFKNVHSTYLDRNRGLALAVSMIALAFWDTILLWCAFFYYGVKELPGASDSDILKAFTPWVHAFGQVSNTASIWCVVLIISQRFMATRDPFKVTRAVAAHSFRSERRVSTFSSLLCCATYRRLFRIPLAISIAATVVNIPAFFEMVAVPCWSHIIGRPSLQLELSEIRRTENYVFWYKLIFRTVTTSCGPNIVIILLVACTLWHLNRSNRSRRELFKMSDSLSDRYSSRETMQTMISIIIVSKFVLFRSCSFVLDIMEIAKMLRNTSILINIIVDISNFLIVFNSATNCLVFLRAPSFLNDKIIERKTMKRKKTMCDQGQIFGDRLALLMSSWREAYEMTGRQLGVRILYNMMRKHPQLYEMFRNQQVHPFVRASTCSNEKSVRITIESVPLCVQIAPARRSFDFLTNSKRKTWRRKRKTDVISSDKRYQEAGERVETFITEILNLMSTGQTEQSIMLRIRRVGQTHHQKGIHFSSSVWKEFKSSILCIMGEIEYPSSTIKDATIEAWGTFVSMLIREMKLGVMAVGDSVGSMS